MAENGTPWVNADAFLPILTLCIATFVDIGWAYETCAGVYTFTYREEIDIDDLSEVACITKTYLIRLFRKKIGTSPLQYINKKKVERAQLLLCTTDMLLKFILFS